MDSSTFVQGHLFRFKLLLIPKGYQSPLLGAGLLLLPEGTEPGVVSVFLSTCDVQQAELGEGWLELVGRELGFRGGPRFSSLSLSFPLCKMGTLRVSFFI